MSGAFQEVSSKKLTASQELLNKIIAVRGNSLQKISEETKIPLSTLRHIKSGVTKTPKVPTFQKIFGFCVQIGQKMALRGD